MLVLKALFILAVVTANLSVTYFGAWALPFTAFFLIPFDLVTRDVIHSRLGFKPSPKKILYHIGSIILIGAVLSYLLNADSKKVALASMITFLAVGLVNTVLYAVLNTTQLKRMNISNGVSSLIDSALFQIIAFNLFSFSLFFTQSLAKIVGGVFWAYLYVRFIHKKEGALSGQL